MKRLAAVLAAGAVGACLSIAPAQNPSPQTFSFALIGDLGYVPAQEPMMANVLAELNATTDLTFVVHVGDLGAPPRSCTNEIWALRLAQFQASVHPFVFTPGDNEWTDCHEKMGAPGFDPIERLTRLRAVFFPGEQSLGRRTIPLTRQSQTADPVLSKYRENVRWTHGGVTFITLHVVGSNNGLGRNAEGDVEYRERDAANLEWLRQGFAHASATESRAIMILQQANIFPAFLPFPAPPGARTNGFDEIRSALRQETIRFGRPVVLVHGDSHFFRIDQPLGVTAATAGEAQKGRPRRLDNFTRVETFGTPNHHWVHVTVDADEQVFTFRQRIVKANIAKQ